VLRVRLAIGDEHVGRWHGLVHEGGFTREAGRLADAFDQHDQHQAQRRRPASGAARGEPGRRREDHLRSRDLVGP
jgi:hypothetical protein